MGSRTFDGVRFSAYTDDHLPPHVHGHYSGVTVILKLIDGRIQLANRKDRIVPLNAKRSDVNHIIRTAGKYANHLHKLWRNARG